MNKYRVEIENKDRKIALYILAENPTDAENEAYGIMVKNCRHAIEFEDIKILGVKKV